jgi:predicted AAA+ superfamily ATPase
LLARILILNLYRLELIEVPLTPFSYDEVETIRPLWQRGGFTRSFLAKSAEISGQWREAYVRNFLEQDIPNLGICIPPMQLRRFWMMLAHYHGNIFNASEIGNALGLSSPTVRKYLDVLTGTFVSRQS